MGSVEPSVAETSSAIRVRGLDHWFGEGEAKKQVLYDINLDIAPGKLTI